MGTDELFDVVDADDRVHATATRATVHRDGLRHRAAHILVYDADGRLYVQRRALDKECSPGAWDSSAAGHVAAGEDYDRAAQRELFEELGLDARHRLEPLFKLAASDATGNEFVQVFRTLTQLAVSPDPAEIIDGRWCDEPTLASWLAAAPADFTGTFCLIWARLHRP